MDRDESTSLHLVVAGSCLAAAGSCPAAFRPLALDNRGQGHLSQGHTAVARRPAIPDY